METMLEYLTYTKGWEYIITIVVVFAFIAFWELLCRERPEARRKQQKG